MQRRFRDGRYKSVSLQSTRGRQKLLDILAGAGNGLVVEPLFATIDRLEDGVYSTGPGDQEELAV
ncbi:MAG TPA: hypothetical protein DHU26_05055 [Spirochaetaceae bacterium]|nr:hypothetical protein [Spirochaetaceae bacterium]